MNAAAPQVTARAHALVREYVALSAASALIPAPIVCTTLVTAVHVELLVDLSALYRVPIEPRAARAILVAGLAGAATDGLIRLPAVRHFVAAFAPIVIPMWFIGGSVIAGTFTHWLGQAFIRHYEQGGVYADFDWAGFRKEIARKVTFRSGPSRALGAAAPV